MSFESFHLHSSIMSGVHKLGFVEPTPIQEKTIPPIIQGKDLIGLAQTGTGKTAAFVLPLLQRLLEAKRGKVGALIVSPTRELAEQTSQAIHELGSGTKLRSLAVYGGVNISPQIQKLKQGVEIIVACPGRLLDHLWQGNIDLSDLKILVIDEADRMFDMGFLPDIKNILRCIVNPHQTLLFSATMPDDIRKLVEEILHEPVTVKIGQTKPAITVAHALYPVEQHLKTALLEALLQKTETESVLVFTRTKHRTERVAEQLKKSGYRVSSLQGNLSQNQRQAALEGFRSGRYKILVATDIAARGLDVQEISHVINYDMPETTDDYIHRIGRTGRVGQSGDAFTFITGEDTSMVRSLERLLKAPIERRVVEGFNYTKSAPARDFKRTPSRRPMRNTGTRRPAAARA